MSHPAPIVRIVVRDGVIVNATWYPSPCQMANTNLNQARLGGSDWEPTSDAISALPAPIRAYIAELQPRCDPALDLLELVLLRDQINALLAKLDQQT